MNTLKMADLTQELVNQYRRQPKQTPETITGMAAYWPFVEGAEVNGFTGPHAEGDDDFASRSPEWLSNADLNSLQRWLHSLLRCERWNGEWPTAILNALQVGQIQALAERLRFYR